MKTYTTKQNILKIKERARIKVYDIFPPTDDNNNIIVVDLRNRKTKKDIRRAGIK